MFDLQQTDNHDLYLHDLYKTIQKGIKHITARGRKRVFNKQAHFIRKLPLKRPRFSLF